MANKYFAKKTTIGGMTFDSKKEAERASYLQWMEKAGKIEGLNYQTKFEIIPAQDSPQGRMRAVCYVADFTYYRDGKLVIEDVKGIKKGAAYNLFVIKKKLMMQKGFYVHEV